ncbi:MAG TPA: patatin-like phospholipase family protein, partial [Solimonas sp.]|nr:patatin-like phospholipase family protein [Solimonas sp.]
RPLGEIAALEAMGEIAILSEQCHTATVRTVRDSVLLRLPREDLLRLLRRHPDALMQLSQVVVGRLLERLRRPDPGPPGPRTIAVIPAHPGVDHRAVSARLARHLSRLGTTCLLRMENVEEALGPGAARCRFDTPKPNLQLVKWLNAQEMQYQYVIYEADFAPGPWARRCMRQADRIVVVADEDCAPQLTPMLDLLAATDIEAPVAMLIPLDQRRPASTLPLQWRNIVGLKSSCHFARKGREDDYARLARNLVGQGIGLVLSGGGARGFAHLGLLQAAQDLGIPIDNVGGASMGAFIGALHAAEYSIEDMIEIVRETFVRRNFLNDYTLPRFALIRARRFRHRLEEIFGGLHIEQLPRPYYCVSSNLSNGESLVHRDGPLGMWVGVSMSVPGIAPPLVWHDSLLVDGGVLNNLPTDVMRELGRGPVIASDVSSDSALRAEGLAGPDPEALLHWPLQAQRPGLFEILMRSATLTSDAYCRDRSAVADCYIRMPVQGVGMFDWKSLDALMDTARQHSRRPLERFREQWPQARLAA